jgi:hypothetical protein
MALSAVTIVALLVTIGAIVLLLPSQPSGECSADLQERSNKWCQAEFRAFDDGRIPTAAEFTAAVGTQRYAWMLGTSYYAATINAAAFTVYPFCTGSGTMAITVFQNGADRYAWSVGCSDPPQVGFPVSGARGSFVITVRPRGSVTAAEYFVR